MEVPKVSIITRCLNRLEYTAQVLNAVKRRTKISYEHIIVDNASTDGTNQWFNWMYENTDWYKGTVRYFRMSRNLGDWGGMLAGYEQARGQYIVQLDNDIIPAEGWLRAMIEVLERSDYRIIMLKRINVAWKLNPLSHLKVGQWETGRVERAVACYMMHRLDFQECARRIPESKGSKSKYIMAGLTKGWKGITPIGKILNLSCTELEAEDQRIKYNPKNPQVWEKI